MTERPRLLCAVWLAALGMIGTQYYFTDSFGFENPFVVDLVSFLLVMTLALVAFVATGRDKITALVFLPLVIGAGVPILALIGTLLAWSIGGFAP